MMVKHVVFKSFYNKLKRRAFWSIKGIYTTDYFCMEKCFHELWCTRLFYWFISLCLIFMWFSSLTLHGKKTPNLVAWKEINFLQLIFIYLHMMFYKMIKESANLSPWSVLFPWWNRRRLSLNPSSRLPSSDEQ